LLCPIKTVLHLILYVGDRTRHRGDPNPDFIVIPSVRVDTSPQASPEDEMHGIQDNFSHFQSNL